MSWNSSHYLNSWILLNRNIPMNLLRSWFISSVVQSCPTVCDPMDCSMPGFPVHHQLKTHVHRVGDAIQPSHPLSSPSLPTFNLSQYQGLFQWVSSLHTVVYNNLDSKCDFAPPTILLRLLLCSWTRVSFLVGSNILLSMAVQQPVVILEFSQKLSSQLSTPPSVSLKGFFPQSL